MSAIQLRKEIEEELAKANILLKMTLETLIEINKSISKGGSFEEQVNKSTEIINLVENADIVKIHLNRLNESRLEDITTGNETRVTI